jgi:hypothetical protein
MTMAFIGAVSMDEHRVQAKARRLTPDVGFLIIWL